jgi:hypothetical protein
LIPVFSEDAIFFLKEIWKQKKISDNDISRIPFRTKPTRNGYFKISKLPEMAHPAYVGATGIRWMCDNCNFNMPNLVLQKLPSLNMTAIASHAP